MVAPFGAHVIRTCVLCGLNGRGMTWVCQRVWGAGGGGEARGGAGCGGSRSGPRVKHGASEGESGRLRVFGGWVGSRVRAVVVRPGAVLVAEGRGLGPASGRGASELGLGSAGALQGWEVLEELGGDDADFVDGLLEGLLGSGGGVLDSGDFPDELSGGLFDLVGVGSIPAGWRSRLIDRHMVGSPLCLRHLPQRGRF